MLLVVRVFWFSCPDDSVFNYLLNRGVHFKSASLGLMPFAAATSGGSNGELLTRVVNYPGVNGYSSHQLPYLWLDWCGVHHCHSVPLVYRCRSIQRNWSYLEWSTQHDTAFHWDCVQQSYHQWNGRSSLASWTYLHQLYFLMIGPWLTQEPPCRFQTIGFHFFFARFSQSDWAASETCEL